jgi:hypothetical protein
MKHWLRLGVATISVSLTCVLVNSCADFTFGTPKGDDPHAGPPYGDPSQPDTKRQSPPPEPTAAQVHSTEVKSGEATWLLHYERKNADGTLVNVLGRAKGIAEDNDPMYFRAWRCKVELDQLTLTGWPQMLKGKSLMLAIDPTTGFVLKLPKTHLRSFGGRTETRIVQ